MTAPADDDPRGQGLTPGTPTPDDCRHDEIDDLTDQHAGLAGRWECGACGPLNTSRT